MRRGGITLLVTTIKNWWIWYSQKQKLKEKKRDMRFPCRCQTVFSAEVHFLTFTWEWQQCVCTHATTHNSNIRRQGNIPSCPKLWERPSIFLEERGVPHARTSTTRTPISSSKPHVRGWHKGVWYVISKITQNCLYFECFIPLCFHRSSALKVLFLILF